MYDEDVDEDDDNGDEKSLDMVIKKMKRIVDNGNIWIKK